MKRKTKFSVQNNGGIYKTMSRLQYILCRPNKEKATRYTVMRFWSCLNNNHQFPGTQSVKLIKSIQKIPKWISGEVTIYKYNYNYSLIKEQIEI